MEIGFTFDALIVRALAALPGFPIFVIHSVTILIRKKKSHAPQLPLQFSVSSEPAKPRGRHPTSFSSEKNVGGIQPRFEPGTFCVMSE